MDAISSIAKFNLVTLAKPDKKKLTKLESKQGGGTPTHIISESEHAENILPTSNSSLGYELDFSPSIETRVYSSEITKATVEIGALGQVQDALYELENLMGELEHLVTAAPENQEPVEQTISPSSVATSFNELARGMYGQLSTENVKKLIFDREFIDAQPSHKELKKKFSEKRRLVEAERHRLSWSIYRKKQPLLEEELTFEDFEDIAYCLQDQLISLGSEAQDIQANQDSQLILKLLHYVN